MQPLVPLQPLSRPSASERRGQPVQHASYWSRRRRERRAYVFQAAERGEPLPAIAAALSISTDEVVAVLATDRRRRPRGPAS